MPLNRFNSLHIPLTSMLTEAVDGLLLATVHVYVPPVLAVRLWMYRAVTELTNTLSVPSVTVVESLVQVTLVAGPLVETQVMVNGKPDPESTLILRLIFPVGIACTHFRRFEHFYKSTTGDMYSMAYMQNMPVYA